jgi:hypothetical protein
MLTEHGKAAKRTALAATAIAALSLAATLLSARSVLAEAKLVRTDPPNDSILTEAPARRQAASAGRFDTSASLGDHLLGPPMADREMVRPSLPLLKLKASGRGRAARPVGPVRLASAIM